jgi:biopolymer transport protein ExbB
MVRFFIDGGIFMWPLLLESILVLGFFIERLYTFLCLRSEEQIAAVSADLNARLESGTSLDQLRAHCGQLGRLEGEVFAEGIDRFEHLSRERRTLEEMRGELNGAVERASLRYCERYLPVESFCASSSVLLGLLGTVSGMITAFEGIAAKGLGEPTIVAAGIAEALITTVTGLVIAVPALTVHSYFGNRAVSKAIAFEPYGHGFVDALLRRWQGVRAA